MKNLLIYYFLVLLPIPLLILALYDATLFSILLIFYIFYRSFIDGQRLLDKKLINKREFWKNFIPFWRAKFYRQLYFER